MLKLIKLLQIGKNLSYPVKWIICLKKNIHKSLMIVSKVKLNILLKLKHINKVNIILFNLK